MKTIKFCLCSDCTVRILVFLIFFCGSLYSQVSNQKVNSIDTELENLAQKIAGFLNHEEGTKLNIAIWDFTDLDGNAIKVGKYISENLSIHIINYRSDFQIIDRNHMQTRLKEHKLRFEGHIDPMTAKELGKIIHADYVVTGMIAILDSKLNITAKIINTETANIIGGAIQYVPYDNNIKELLGISSSSSNGLGGRGFNSPINSQEGYNNPNTVVEDCAKLNVGDYCFINHTSKRLEGIFYDGKSNKTITLGVGETQCLYNLSIGTLEYRIYEQGNGNKGYYVLGEKDYSYSAKGQVLVEKCKSKSYQIR